MNLRTKWAYNSLIAENFANCADKVPLLGKNYLGFEIILLPWGMPSLALHGPVISYTQSKNFAP